jgi:branched-subunit amino acid ABC-type transport system permease component
MSWTGIASQMVLGLSTGAIYVLVSLGLTMIFGMMNVLNFTHGVLYALGAYFGYLFVKLTGSFWLSLALAPVVVGLIGVLVEQISIRPLADRPHLIQFLATFALALIIEQIIRLLAGNEAFPVSLPELFTHSVQLGPIVMPSYRLFLIATAVVVCAAIGTLLARTQIGALIRASAEDPEMTALLRVNPRAVSVGVFAGGSALAALAGVLAAPVFSVHPSMGEEVITMAFLIVTAGGLGSLRGTILAAVILSEASSLGLLAVGKYSDVLTICLMAAVFLFWPAGIFGRAESR